MLDGTVISSRCLSILKSSSADVGCGIDASI